MPPSDPAELAVSIVLPTYNEAESLPVIVPRIAQALAAADIAGEVIVVDDNSPDGTAEVAKQLSEQWPVRVLKRVDERGLATAVLAGFGLSRAQVCVVMDADGSHPVEALPTMVQMIQQDKADIVVGSRHVPGGGSRDWPLFSQFKSKLAATLALGVTSMTDPTTGFMAARRSLLEHLELDPVGWKIVLEIVVKAAPVRVAEVPIVFVDREFGVSKQSLGVFGEYLTHLSKLYAYRYPSLAELVMFCAIGVLGLVLDLGTVVLLKETLALDTRLCAVGGFTMAVTSNFVLNRKFTFPRARELPLLFSYATYVGTNLAGLAVRMLTIVALMALAGLDKGRGYLLTNLIGIVLATLVNFVGAKYFAFDPERLRFTAQTDATGKKPSSIPPRARTWALGLLFAGSLGYAFATSVPSPVLHFPDEGVNVTMARNIERSSRFFTRPSVYPGGRSDWLREDLPALGNLPIYPALLALMKPSHGLSGLALISWLALCVTIYSTARMVGLIDPKAGAYTALLMACSPAVLLSYRRIEFEPVLTALCAAGTYQFVRGAWQRKLLRCGVGGALIGLGFLTKMWLIVPYAFALIAFCVVEAAAVRSSGTSAGLRKSVAAGALGFALTACSHLAYVAIVSPQDLSSWVGWVYLGIFSGRGVTGPKLSASLAQYAHLQHSSLYYALVLYRDHFFLLPLCLFGLGELLRVPQPRRSRLMAMILGAAVAVVALSVPAYKDARYVLPVQPFLYALSGLCLAALARAPGKLRPGTVSVVRASMLLSAAAFVVVLLMHVIAGPKVVSTPYVYAHAFGTLLCIGLGQLWTRTSVVTRELTGLAAVGLLVFAVVQPRVTRQPPYAAIANVLQTYLPRGPAAYPSFAAPDSEILQGYLDRAGTDLANLDIAQIRAQTGLAAFVIPPAGAATRPQPAVVEWLTREARDVSPNLVAKTGEKFGYQLFVR